MRKNLLLPTITTTAVLGTALLASSPASPQEVWNFDGPQATLGTSQTFLSSPSSIATVASGVGPGGTPVDLFQKNAGGSEVGLGLTNDPAGLNEISNGSFIQLSLGNLSATQAISVSFAANSTTTGTSGDQEAWGLGLSNTSGELGSIVQSGTTNFPTTTTIDTTGFAFLDVTEVTPGVGNGVLMLEMDAPIGITPVIGAPEPLSLSVFGVGLLGLGAVRWKRRKG